MNAPETSGDYRSGFVSLAGRPNVGKSTLVNRILGRELSIVTPKPQTTRKRITAIHTMPNAQMVLHDTPGIHEASTPLNRSLVAAAIKTLEEADIVLLIITPSEGIETDDQRIIDLIKAAGSTSVLAINKIDTVEPPAILPLIDLYRKAYSFQEIVPISALHGDGVQELIQALLKLLPPGPPLFPEEDVSDMPVRFFVEEIIREQVINKTGEEIPYKTAVVVESFKEEKGRVWIHADIHVEKDSQKKILVGKAGRMIKAIGTSARAKIEDFLECRVRLDLFVKVSPNWSRNPAKLIEFGYH
jgi:GTP-binding protein Era